MRIEVSLLLDHMFVLCLLEELHILTKCRKGQKSCDSQNRNIYRFKVQHPDTMRYTFISASL